MINPILLTETNAPAFDEMLLGGKAKNLAWLSRNNFPVPAWYVVTTEGFRRHLDRIQQSVDIRSQLSLLAGETSPVVIKDLSKSIQSIILSSDLCDEIKAAIESEVGKDTDVFYAVRSSVVGEDAQAVSFAGQMDSYLFQRGLDALFESVVKVMASAFNERALLYRLNRGISLDDISAAVIVQKMIAGETSGVMFTAHAGNGSREHMLISACYGAGEGVVSGHCNTDEYSVGLFHDAIESKINIKDTAIVFDSVKGLGLTEVSVGESEQSQSCLNDAVVLALRDVGLKIATLRQSPQDIEWTVCDGQVYILQTRPITTLPSPSHCEDHLTVWDNSNIQESYCGVTTPLTFSFASRAYATVYEQTMRVLGANEVLVAQNRHLITNLLGLVRGRIYYNINNWYECLLLGPSFKSNKSDMERMMGLTDSVDMVQEPQRSLLERIRRLPQLLRCIVGLTSGFRNMDRLVNQFHLMFKTAYRSVDRSSLHTLSIGQLIELTQRLDREILMQWTTPIINDCYVMIYNGKVHKALESAGVENPELIQNNLLSGEEGIESTEPTKYLLALCETIRKSEPLITIFENTSNAALLGVLQSGQPDFHQRCLDYIELYGDRTMGELKLESITLRQDPSFMFAVLKNFVKKEDLTLDTLKHNEARFRQEAENEGFARIEQVMGNRKLGKFKKDLAKLRSAIKNRENMRLARTRLFSLYRDVYLEIGAQLALHSRLVDARDILYLTVEEIQTFYEGRCVQADFASLVASRKQEYAEYEKQDLPHHFYTRGPAYIHNEFIYPHAETSVLHEDGSLHGTGCYPGLVESSVRLIFSPEDELDLDGQILCTVRTDPGWAPLFPSAGGIVVERGSTLSHSAVVARELGIPAIVGIPGLTSTLKNGEIIRMDGASGIILRLSNSSYDAEGRTSELKCSPAEDNPISC